MTNEEYEKEIIAFLEKTKTMNDQKVKKVLGDKIDELELKKLEGKKKEIIEFFKHSLEDCYESLIKHIADKYGLEIYIDEDEIDDIEDLNIKGEWIKKN